jgi:hypothetical protein
VLLLPERSVSVSSLTGMPANGAGRCGPSQILADRGTDTGIGKHQKRTAKYVGQYAQLADIAVAAVEQFFANIRSGEFPGEAETHHVPEESEEILQQLSEMADELPVAGVVTDTFLADEAMEQQNRIPGSQVPHPYMDPHPHASTLGCQGRREQQEATPGRGPLPCS